MIFQLILLAVILAPGAISINLMNQKTWTYTMLSITSSSADEKLLTFDLSMERVARGLYSISGTFERTIDVTDDDMIEVESYFSASGNNDYKKLPFKIAKQKLNEFMKTTYKKMLISSLADCSNMPQSDNPVIEKNKKYFLKKCQVSNDAFPSYMKEGYYKILIIGTGLASYQAEFIVEVERKI